MRNNLKNSYQRIVSLIICFVFVLSFASFDEKTFAEPVIVDFETTGLEIFTLSQNGGVEIKTVGGNKYMNISPTVDGMPTFANFTFTPKPMLPMEISYDFMINDYLNNGTKIAAISNGIDRFLEIEVKDNALVSNNSIGLGVSLVESLSVNKWYNLRMIMDFEKNTYSVYVDDSCVLLNAQSLASYVYTNKEVKLSLSSKYSPGFAIDNFSSSDFQVINRVVISGEKNITVVDGHSHKAEFTAKSYDYEGIVIEAAEFDYMLKPDNQGVTASIDGNKITVDIAEDAIMGEYTLYVISGAVVETATLNISKYYPVIDNIEILGDGKMAYGFNNNEYPFRVKITDQLGYVLTEGDVTWTLEGAVPAEIQLDSQTGLVTVTGELEKDKHITLKATLNSNPSIYDEKVLTLEDAETYRSDNEVFDILKTHIENIWTYAADQYHGSPLLAQAIDRLSLEPARWYVNTEFSYVPCNMAAVSQLLRASDVMYLMTGEEKYRQRVDDSLVYFVDNFTSENGLVPWGGHDVVDMEAHEHRSTTTPALELKGHDPYMEPLWRLRPEWAERFTTAVFSAQIKDWYTMALSRHAYFTDNTDPTKFYSNTESYTPSNKGYSPAYTTNLGFSATLYGFARLVTDMYRATKDEHAANAFMKIWDAYWRVASPDPDYWLDVNLNTTAGRKGYPDEAVEGVKPIVVGPYNEETGEYQWWLLDPIPGFLQNVDYGDRYWRARGEDLIKQGFITEEEQWKARECYIIEGLQSTNPVFLYWDFVDAIGKDHPYADIVVERAIRNVSNWIRMAYIPSNSTYKTMLIDGTDLTGFVCQRGGYFGGVGGSYKTYGVGEDAFCSVVFNYLNALEYPQYQEQIDIMWNFIKTYADNNELGILGTNKLGDEGTDVNLGTTNSSYGLILAFIHLYEATGNSQFIDMARVLAKNYVEAYTADGFIVGNTDWGTIYTGGDASNGVYILALLEASIRGEFDECPSYVKHTGFREEEGFVEYEGKHYSTVNEFTYWQFPMPRIKAIDLELAKEELELKVGEIYPIEYTIYPDDASDKGVYISTDNTSSIAVDLDNNSIQAIKPGTGEVIVRSTNDIMLKKKIKVTVTE